MPITYEMNLVASLALLGRKRRCKLFITVHGPIRRYDQAGPLYRFAAMALSRAFYPRADRVITVSRGIADELLARKWARPERVTTINNPVISDRISALASEPAPKLAREASVPAIVNVGRLVPAKNHLLLLDAFKLVTQKRGAQLWLVGDGPCRADVEERIDELGLSDSVRLFGHVSNPLPIVRAADLFVLSSVAEGFGNVLVEAMFVGTPIVSTDCPHGPREILEGGLWGTLVPPGDANALGEAILEALAGGGIDARQRAGHFTVERAVGAYLALITESAGKA
jgi:glycosyltransferase involved in cell wall biosynthesis